MSNVVWKFYRQLKKKCMRLQVTLQMS